MLQDGKYSSAAVPEAGARGVLPRPQPGAGGSAQCCTAHPPTRSRSSCTGEKFYIVFEIK